MTRAATQSGAGGWSERWSPVVLGVSAGLLVFSAAALAGWSLHRVGVEALTEHVRKELIGYARVGAQLVDGDKHKTFISTDQESSAAYLKAVDPLRQLQVAQRELEFVYTLTLHDGKVRFVLDPTEAGDHDGDGQDDKSHIGEVYEQPTEAMLEALRSMRPTAETEVSADKWGSFISGYAPFFDSQRRFVGVVGVDLSARDYVHRIESLDQALGNCLLLSLLLGACSGLAAGTLRARHSAGRHALRRASIVEAQRRVLQLVASSVPLGKLLSAVCREAEGLVPGIWCSIWIQRDGGGTYRAVSQTAPDTGTSDPIFEHEVGSPVIGSDGRTLGRVMIKLPPGVDRRQEVQELSEAAASLASIAIEKRSAEEELHRAHAEVKSSREHLEGRIQACEQELQSARKARLDLLAELGLESQTALADVPRIVERLSEVELEPGERALINRLRNRVCAYIEKLDHLAELARITSLPSGFIEESVIVAEELRSTSRPVQQQCSERGIDFRLSIQSSLERVSMRNQAKLRQILSSLLHSMIHERSGGDVTLEAKLDLREGSWLVISLESFGLLPSESLGYDSRLQKRHGLRRLTLDIASQLIEGLGGKMSADGTPGSDEVISLRIPLHAAAARLAA